MHPGFFFLTFHCIFFLAVYVFFLVVTTYKGFVFYTPIMAPYITIAIIISKDATMPHNPRVLCMNMLLIPFPRFTVCVLMRSVTRHAFGTRQRCQC